MTKCISSVLRNAPTLFAQLYIRRRPVNGLSGFLFLATMFPAAVLAQQVSIDFDKDADFSKYKTYAHRVCHPVNNPRVDKRIVKEIESRIAMGGLIRAHADH